MAARTRPIHNPRCSTSGCFARATQEVFDSYGKSFGYHCDVHATSKLVSLDMYEYAMKLNLSAETSRRDEG